MEIEVFGSSSKGNSYLIKDENHSLMLDCGIHPKRIQINWSQIEGILVSHEHVDHAKYISHILKRCGGDVYCPEGTKNKWKTSSTEHRMYVVESSRSFYIKDWHILPFKTSHVNTDLTHCDSLGYLIETPITKKRVLYATDTCYIKYKFKRITHALLEANYSMSILEERARSGYIDIRRKERLLISHFEINNLVSYIKACDWSELEEMYLIHLSDTNSNAEQFKKQVQSVIGIPVYIAKEGGGIDDQ